MIKHNLFEHLHIIYIEIKKIVFQMKNVLVYINH